MSHTRWLVLAALAAGLAVAGWTVSRRAEAWAHTVITAELSARLQSEVTLDGVDLGWIPRLSVAGTDLVVRHRGRRDIPPLIVVRRFTASTTWWSLAASRVDAVTVAGLEMAIPPGRSAEMPHLDADGPSDRRLRSITIGRLEAEHARLSILPRQAGRNPRVFDIFRLDLVHLRLDKPSAFTATLTNPVPFGRIVTEGSFGPWAAAEPALTPVAGTFVFGADLGTIKGIAGALTSEGRFSGPLTRIVATGRTATPDFRIPKLDASALPLTTEFDAVIDGTSGDVELTRVDARLGGTALVACGRIEGVDGVKGRHVGLTVRSDDGHIEDMLRLTVPATPPLMVGAMSLRTTLDLPPGPGDVLDRLRLDGSVAIARARFTRDAVQDRVDELSRRGRGRPDDPAIEDVASNLEAAFTLDRGILAIAHLAYTVRGARIRLAGSYALERQALDFSGEALLNASVSDTQRGLKHYLLMPFDPLFRRKGAGTRLAIDVTGTVREPKFGVAVGRTLLGR